MMGISAEGKKNKPPRSRDTICPSFANKLRPESKRAQPDPQNKRAQGRPGARCTRGLVCNDVLQESAHEHTGSAEAVRPSLRNGFTAYFVLSPVTGFLATVAPEKR
jgi:hypothetical protein